MQRSNVILLEAKRKAIEPPLLATFTVGPVEMALAAMMSASRGELEAIIAAGIERLDELDGDADLEANGDEADGDWLEDEFGVIPASDGGAGCPVADAGELEDHWGQGEWLIDQRTASCLHSMADFRGD